MTMKLLPTEDDGDALSACLISDCKRIHMGIYTVIYGYRVRAGFYRDRHSFYMLDYCCGSNQVHVEMIYSMVKNILEQKEYSEDIFNCFPRQERKPFFTDGNNFNKMVEMIEAPFEPVVLPSVLEIRKKQVEAIFKT